MKNSRRLLLSVHIALTVGLGAIVAVAQKHDKAFMGTLNDFPGTWTIDPQSSEYGVATKSDYKNFQLEIAV